MTTVGSGVIVFVLVGVSVDDGVGVNGIVLVGNIVTVAVKLACSVGWKSRIHPSHRLFHSVF